MASLNNRIAIIGAGSVGGAIASALLLRRVVADIHLVDIDEARCRAQVADLADSAFLSNGRIAVGTPKDAGQADIIIVTAGAKQRPGDTRLDLVERNRAVLTSVIEGMQPIRKDAILLLVANPVDVLTFLAQKISGLPKSQVLGTGTLLDSIRLRNTLAERIGVRDLSTSGQGKGSQEVAWASATIGTSPLLEVFPMDSEARSKIEKDTANKAYQIIEAKGFTSYGIGAVSALVCESIIFDQRQVFALSHYRDGWRCCLSTPVTVGRHGLGKMLPVKLEKGEQELLEKSARNMRDVLAKFEQST